jgi:hypothetical protein
MDVCQMVQRRANWVAALPADHSEEGETQVVNAFTSLGIMSVF